MKVNIGFSLLTIVAVLFMACTGAKIYTAPQFSEYRDSHHVVAILPLTVNIDTKKLPKDFTIEMAHDAEKVEGFLMQEQLYIRLLDRMEKDHYTVKFQDVAKTNALLTKADIKYENLTEYTKDEICRLLEADAVISGNIMRERPMSTGLAVGLGVLFGIWGNTNKVNVTLSIHEKQAGDLVWKYDHEASGSVGSSSEKLAESLMKNVSKKFPYKPPKS